MSDKLSIRSLGLIWYEDVHGIAFRPLEETIRDTLNLYLAREPYDNWQSGLRVDDNKTY